MICKQCGTAYRGEHVLPGSGWIEFILYFAYVFPGIIYSIWRRSTRRPTCAACGSRDMVGVQTPIGQKLAREHYPNGIPPAPAAAVRVPTAVDKVVHRTTAVLLWLLGSLVALTVVAVLLSAWMR